MPLYEYECPNCGTVTERIKTTKVTVIDCPNCKMCSIRKVSPHAKMPSAWEVNKCTSPSQ